MTRAEALRKIAELHTAWSVWHAEEVPAPTAGDSDESVWHADLLAPPEIDDSLNRQIKAILAQVDP